MYYGRAIFHMTREEILIMTIGEMLDLINCNAIYNGVAKPKTSITDMADVLDLE